MHKERFETVLPDQLRRRYRSPVPPPSYIRPVKPRQRRPAWLAFSAALICSAVLGAVLISRPQKVAINTSSVSSPPAIPPAEPVPVLRAGLVPHGIAHMPDGTSVHARMLGSVTSQEELPLIGNHAGDTFLVNRVPFVWTLLNNGQGTWIDPEMEQ